jgi:nucleotide-binding universal stress UspA family protein
MIKRNVLVPLDRSDYSLKILPPLEKFIPPSDTKLILFHVAERPGGIGIGKPVYEVDYVTQDRVTSRVVGQIPFPVYANQLENDIRSQIKDSLQPQVRHLAEKGYQVTTLVYFGQPADEIMRVISDEKIDLIAMTTHAREGLTRFFLGSVTEKVLHRIKIPILLMHPS